MFFQSWCPGCHSRGLPDLKKMVDALKEKDNISFLAIQTVFEGHKSNTYEKMVETPKTVWIKKSRLVMMLAMMGNHAQI